MKNFFNTEAWKWIRTCLEIVLYGSGILLIVLAVRWLASMNG